MVVAAWQFSPTLTRGPDPGSLAASVSVRGTGPSHLTTFPLASSLGPSPTMLLASPLEATPRASRSHTVRAGQLSRGVFAPRIAHPEPWGGRGGGRLGRSGGIVLAARRGGSEAGKAPTWLIGLGLIIVWQGVSVLFHMGVDHMPIEKAFFFSVDTGLSIGFGSVRVETNVSRIFNTIHVMIGAGGAGALLAIFASSLVEASRDAASDELAKALIPLSEERKTGIGTRVVENIESAIPVSLLVVWICLGTAYGLVYEEWDFVKSLYFAVTALSTAGLQGPTIDPVSGDLPPFNALLVGMYCLTGVPLFAYVLGLSAQLVADRLVREKEREIIRREIDQGEFMQNVCVVTPNGKICKTEFLILQLLRLEKTDMKTVRLILDQFDVLDKDRDGSLSPEEALALSKRGTEDGLYSGWDADELSGL